MRTQCKQTELEFQGLRRRRVVGRFDGGDVSSDGGALLLREVAERTGILERFAGCFEDGRRDGQIEHTVGELISQRVYGIALGYEDVIDHDELRRDPLFATVVGKADPTGGDRSRERDRGCALAGKSTLNRLETKAAVGGEGDRYKRISYRSHEIDRLLAETFLDAHAEPPDEIVLDLDATDDPLHGEQEGRFFHGYYREYCYLPLYIFSGGFVLCARLRRSNSDASAGSLEELGPIVEQIRARWPGVRIIIRADADFCRDQILSWCEANGVDYVVGLAKNARLLKRIRKQLERVRRKHLVSGEAVRAFRSFTYRTLDSWSRRRRVVAKAEHLAKGANPRFVATSLSAQTYGARALYEGLYCARGDMENRIKEQQLYLFADRTSSHTMRANQLRLYFSTIAYVLLNELRRVGLRGTQLARAQVCTIRTKLLKIGVIVTLSVRRVRLAFSSGYPYKSLFSAVVHNLSCGFPLRV